MRPYEKALCQYCVLWAISHLFGIILGFTLFDTSHGTSTIRQRLIRSLQCTGALYLFVGSTWLAQNPHPLGAPLVAMGTLVAAHLALLSIAGVVRISSLD